jgi:hypothetical protein
MKITEKDKKRARKLKEAGYNLILKCDKCGNLTGMMFKTIKKRWWQIWK